VEKRNEFQISGTDEKRDGIKKRRRKKMTEAERDLIERACEKLSIAYARHIDFREYEAFADLFTEDGVLEVFGNQLRGRKSILTSMSDRPANRKSLHIFTNIWTNVLDQDNATGKTYLSLFRADHDGPGPAPNTLPLLAGYYDDVFVRTPKGWRFASRKATMLFMQT
jgi:hypothetical protein